MAQYFFKMSQAEKNNILDKHKHVYDGYVTEYGQNSNQQPLYVQDFANDKEGITVSNKGVVKPYTNMNINEDIDRRDRIGDGANDLDGGTVDIESDDMNFVSLGKSFDDPYNEDMDSDFMISVEFDELDEDYEYDIDRDFSEDLAGPMNYEVEGDSFRDEVDDEEIPDFMEKLNESLDMFKRMRNYN